MTEFEVRGKTNLNTNSGSCSGIGATAEALALRVSFNDIERLHVIGTNQDDFLAGTQIDVNSYLHGFDTSDELAKASNARGDDILKGGGGNDVIIAFSGDDILDGGAGDDVLYGGQSQFDLDDDGETGDGRDPSSEDRQEVDTMTGGEGADLFVLGDEAGSYYVYIDENAIGVADSHAIIMDFDPTGDLDRIQLNGSPDDYTSTETPEGHTVIYRSGFLRPELIAEIRNFTGFSFDPAGYIDYVTPGGRMGLAPLPEDAPSPDLGRVFAPPALRLAPVAVAAPGRAAACAGRLGDPDHRYRTLKAKFTSHRRQRHHRGRCGELRHLRRQPLRPRLRRHHLDRSRRGASRREHIG